MNNSDQCKDGMLNLSDPVDADNVLYTSTEDLMFTVILPLLLFIGISANSAFIFVVSRVKTMQTITNAYLTNLSATDLIFVGISCCVYIANYAHSRVRDDVKFSSWMGCLGMWFGIMTTYFTSLVTITLVTVEKYSALCHPLRHMTINGKGRTIKLLIISWLIGTVLGFLTSLGYPKIQRLCVEWPDTHRYNTMPEVIEYCAHLHPIVNIFADSIFVVSFCVVFICSSYMYTRIIIALSSRPTGENDTSGASTSQALQALRVRNQVARLLIKNGMIFFCCQAPYRLVQVHTIWSGITGRSFMSLAQLGGLNVIARGLVLVNSCINPFVYYVSSLYYRSAFKQAFCRRNEQASLKSAVTMSSVHR